MHPGKFLMKPNPEQHTAHPASAVAQPGKYLTFRLANESYAIPVLKVREIIRLCPVTPVANMPAHIKGVINLRGKVIPLVDLRAKFQLPISDDNDRTCIVVTQLAAAGGGTRLYGIVVDGVEEVTQFGPADIEPTPDFGGAIEAQFITGMAKLGGGVKTLIDLEEIAAEDGTIAIRDLKDTHS